LKLKRVLSKKNPYLFKAKYVLTAQDIVDSPEIRPVGVREGSAQVNTFMVG
jgi:hypothetical protein